MKKILSFLIVIIALASCGKENTFSTDYGNANFINATPGTPSFQVFVDTIISSPTAVGYRGSSGYLPVSPGTRNIELRSSSDLKTLFSSLNSESITTNTARTYVAYDTQTVASKVVKILRLTDDLTVPAAGTIKFRLLHLAVNAPAVDVTFLRTSVTPSDSVTVANQTYIGASPNTTTLSPFNGTLPVGAYTIKVKAAGTQNVITSATLSSAAANAPFSSLYTFYCTGSAVGQPVSIGSFRHYP